MPLLSSFTGSGVDPRVSSALSLSPTVVRVTFNEVMRINPALTTAANYTLVPDFGSVARTVLSVSLDGQTQPTYVLITLSGPATPGVANYAVTAANVLDAAGNPINLAFDTADFNGIQTDFAPPFFQALDPAPGRVIAVDATLLVGFGDADSGINLSTVSVILTVGDAAPVTAVLGGVIQAPFTGSVVAIAGGYLCTINPATDFDIGLTINIAGAASDLAIVPNAFTGNYNVYTTSVKPTAIIAQTRYDAVIGSVVQFDGRKSSASDYSAIGWEWKLLQVPRGSTLENDVGAVNPASMKDLRTGTFSAMSFIPDKLGLYIVELVTRNGGMLSDAITAEVHVGLTRALSGEGVVPDTHFLWNFISNFWNLVEDRKYIETMWSGAVQVLGAEFIKLWSNDYNKSLATIQASVQRHWVKFDCAVDISNRIQRVIVGNTAHGSTGATGNLVSPGVGATRVFHVPVSAADFVALGVNYGAKGRVIDINGAGYTLERVFNSGVTSLVVVDGDGLIAGQVGLNWRLPHLLHVPLLNLEELGVSPRDTLIFDVRRADTGLSAELRAQVVAVDGERLGFEFTLADLNINSPTVDHALFRQLAVDLRLAHPSASDEDITAAGEALIAYVPTGINLSQRPFTEFQITFTAKKIVRNSKVLVEETLVSIPHLQRELKAAPAVIYQENWDYELQSSFIQFVSGLFSASSPAPDTLWAECVHVDNAETVESNFGRLAGLLRDDLQSKATRPPYLSAVKGIWYALTSQPSIDAIRLGIQILMGLPFTEARGELLVITENFTTDAFGKNIGRLLVEDVDDNDRRTGVRHVHYYPMDIGLEDNPRTGAAYAVGDVIEAFKPLSKGVIVTDYVREPRWWVRTLHGLEILKFFTFRAQIDVESGVFDHRDLHFALEFIRQIKPAYTQLVASALRSLEDADILGDFEDQFAGTIGLTLYDNVTGIEATVRLDDDNHQGFTLWRGDSRPFSTRSAKILRDIAINVSSGYVATSATGFGSPRARVNGDATHPAVEGDILVIHRLQANAGHLAQGLYEIDVVTNVNTVSLGNVATPYDPVTLSLVAPASLVNATGLRGIVVRRDRNPVLRGTDLVLTGANNIATSASAAFISNGVGPDDHLIIESGANAGEYRIEKINAVSSPRSYTPTNTPHISATQVALVALDGTVPVFAALSGQDFRVVRPTMLANRIEKVQVLNTAGVMFLSVLDVAGGSAPFDVFTPGMVGTFVNVANAQNPANDGTWTITSYVHAGLVATNAPASTSDASAQAVVTLDSPYHPGYERIVELAPTEAFLASVA